MEYAQLAIETVGYLLALLELFRKTARLEEHTDRLREYLMLIIANGLPIRIQWVLLVFPWFLSVYLMIEFDAHHKLKESISGHFSTSAVPSFVLSIAALIIMLVIQYILIDMLTFVGVFLFLLVTCLAHVLTLIDRHPAGSVGGFGLLLTICPRLIEWLL